MATYPAMYSQTCRLRLTYGQRQTDRRAPLGLKPELIAFRTHGGILAESAGWGKVELSPGDRTYSGALSQRDGAWARAARASLKRATRESNSLMNASS